MADGSREERTPESSSPTCLASTILIVLALAAQYGWTIRQFDIAKAYMLAAPFVCSASPARCGGARDARDTSPSGLSDQGRHPPTAPSPPTDSIQGKGKDVGWLCTSEPLGRHKTLYLSSDITLWR